MNGTLFWIGLSYSALMGALIVGYNTIRLLTPIELSFMMGLYSIGPLILGISIYQNDKKKVSKS